MAAVALGGVLLRAFAFVEDGLVDDAAWYAAMARSLLEHGEFLLPGTVPPAYTHHFPPLFPAFLAAFFLAMGPTMAAVALAHVAAAAIFVGATYATTRDLHGRARGLAVAAVAATFPVLLGFDALGLSETLVAALFLLTIWAIVRSLDRPPFIVLAGLFAALGYLSKASMGPFVALAGGAGLAWRFSYVRWRVFQDRWYMAGAGLFLILVAPWMLRNGLRHGTIDTQPYATRALASLFTEHAWPLVLAQALVASALALALFALPWLPGVRDAVRSIREERTSALWMAVVTPTVVALFFISAFAATEGHDILLSTLTDRYVITALVPLLWLGMRALDLDGPSSPPAGAQNARLARRERAFTWAGLLTLGLAEATRPLVVLSAPRVMLTVALWLAGSTLLFLARGDAWRLSSKDAGGARTWRVEAASPTRGAPLAAILLLALALAFRHREVLLLAAGASLLAWDDRGRVLAVVVVFLGAALGGASAWTPIEEVAADARAAAGEEGTVGVLEPSKPYLYPFLGSATLVPREARPAVLVDVPASRDGTAPPGYELWKTYPPQITYRPGTWLARGIERALTGEAVTPTLPDAARLYVRVT